MGPQTPVRLGVLHVAINTYHVGFVVAQPSANRNLGLKQENWESLAVVKAVEAKHLSFFSLCPCSGYWWGSQRCSSGC